MKPVLFLRIASVLALVQGVLHTIGGVFGTPPPGPGAIAAEAMKTNQFLVTGLTRSYWDFYIGFGLGITISLVIEGIVFWQLSLLAKTDTMRLRPILATFFVGYVCIAIDSCLYFFPPPVIGAALIASCLGLAIFTAKPRAAAFSEQV
jgi:hypothetical protein